MITVTTFCLTFQKTISAVLNTRLNSLSGLRIKEDSKPRKNLKESNQQVTGKLQIN